MKDTGRKLMVYQPRRAEAGTQTLRKILDNGIIGELFMIKLKRAAYVKRSDWQAYKKYAGGVLNNYGAHEIDTALYLAGSSVNKVSGYLNRVATYGDADDVVKVLIETDSGVCIDIDINMASAISLPETVIYGRNGTLVQMRGEQESPYYHVRYFEPSDFMAGNVSDSFVSTDRRYPDETRVNWLENDFHMDKDTAIDFYAKCYAYYALGEAPFIPVTETLAVMRVIHECMEYAGWSLSP
jgi:predicted dehydrogenase